MKEEKEPHRVANLVIIRALSRGFGGTKKTLLFHEFVAWFIETGQPQSNDVVSKQSNRYLKSG
jgi:hypothetical protein